MALLNLFLVLGQVPPEIVGSSPTLVVVCVLANLVTFLRRSNHATYHRETEQCSICAEEASGA